MNTTTRSMTTREFTACLVLVAMILLLVASLGILTSQANAWTRPSCVKNLMQINLTLKMYANESVGNLYPRPGYYHAAEVDCENPVESLDGRLIYEPVGESPKTRSFFMFNMDDVYPEFLPDLNVLVCPKDTGISFDSLVNPKSGQFDTALKCDDPNRGWTLADESFVYLGHVIDKATDLDPTVPYSALKSLDRHCPDDALLSPGDAVGVQFAAWLAYYNTGPTLDPVAFLTDVNNDWDISDVAKVGGIDFKTASSTDHIGNNDTYTLHRLRDGIENLLASDPLDPDSIHAFQRSTFIMWDQTGLDPQALNHAPDPPTFWQRVGNWLNGIVVPQTPLSNVLYLDGHVEEIRFPTSDKPPVNYPSARTTQCMQTPR